MGRLVILDSFNIDAFPHHFVSSFDRIDEKFMRELVAEAARSGMEVVSYIGSQKLFEVVSRVVGVSVKRGADSYTWREGDILVLVVSREQCPCRGGDIESGNLLIYLVVVMDATK